jgi:hypothetical protein
VLSCCGYLISRREWGGRAPTPLTTTLLAHPDHWSALLADPDLLASLLTNPVRSQVAEGLARAAARGRATRRAAKKSSGTARRCTGRRTWATTT